MKSMMHAAVHSRMATFFSDGSCINSTVDKYEPGVKPRTQPGGHCILAGVTALENLQRLSLTLPEPPAAVGAYVTWVRTGNLILTSGQLPWQGTTMLYPGRLGEHVWVEDGYKAARQAALNAIAQLHAATAGDLEKIVRIVRVEGYVHCAPGFRDHPKVLDGASDLFVAVFEERGKHVRTALGIPDMPLNACIQLGIWAEVAA